MYNPISKLSVVVPVCERADDVVTNYYEYKTHCDGFADEVEYIYVVAQTSSGVIRELRQLQAKEEGFTLIVLNNNYGEATELEAGFEHAKGEMILTLPSYLQVESVGLKRLFDEIGDNDFAIARRWPRFDNGINRAQSKVFHYLSNKLANQHVSDIGCGVRLIKSHVLEELHIYGDQHRFFPMLAHQLGFHYVEVDLPQNKLDTSRRFHGPGLYLRRVLDLLAIVFLTKFNKKPMRFFGLLGGGAITTGLLGLIYLAFERLVFSVALADRPLLVLFALFFTLGIQLMAIGLVGEVVVFTHSKDSKEYRIKEIIEG